jgi:hypothetical protein
MTIAKKPDSNQMISVANQITSEQKAFISGAKEQIPTAKPKSVPILLRANSEMLQRIDQAAKKRGLKRAPFILSAAVQLADRILEK